VTKATKRNVWIIGLAVAGIVFASAGYSVNGISGIAPGFLIGVVGTAIVVFFRL